MMNFLLASGIRGLKEEDFPSLGGRPSSSTLTKPYQPQKAPSQQPKASNTQNKVKPQR